MKVWYVRCDWHNKYDNETEFQLFETEEKAEIAFNKELESLLVDFEIDMDKVKIEEKMYKGRRFDVIFKTADYNDEVYDDFYLTLGATEVL